MYNNDVCLGKKPDEQKMSSGCYLSPSIEVKQKCWSMNGSKNNFFEEYRYQLDTGAVSVGAYNQQPETSQRSRSAVYHELMSADLFSVL